MHDDTYELRLQIASLVRNLTVETRTWLYELLAEDLGVASPKGKDPKVSTYYKRCPPTKNCKTCREGGRHGPYYKQTRRVGKRFVTKHVAAPPPPP